ncbi:pimeloyl-ACP methyl ester carboxylesterase [Streptomyces sp. B3I7]|uniref:alpha/beta hydrolase n=1 Tax=Streptomyces sp. B3I7 TaxID=3042269 RepID=UPI002783EBFA|nr:alpha/beta hydrolase [Streptomyces sp. B3I7]MDQ0810117.1 pimeloyl-ACP methyl ester carboxylesterase [Streptomyces sp. B3I7]
MRRTAAVLCGAAIVMAGLPAGAQAGASTAPHAVTSTAVTSTTGALSAGTRATGATRLAWKKCATSDHPTLQCATLKVPLDHAEPNGRKITLALSRVPHTARAFQGPLLVNPGGPGGSGRSLAGFVASSLPKAVAAQYDVIGFDPRGVGASTPALDCAPGHFDPVRPDTVPHTPALEQANLSRARSFAQACGAKYKDLLPYLDTVSAARDMDAMRRALGAKKINYFGYSYGTYLGAVYAKLYPQRVRRLVLDSIVDPRGVWYDDNLQQDHAFDDRHRAFLAWVAAHDAAYGLGTDPARVETEWYAMRAAVAAHPAGGKVGAAELEDTFIPGGYYDGYWPHLAGAFAAYVHDKDAGALVDAYRTFGAVDAGGDNGYSVYTAVQCRDAGWPRDWERWREDSWAVYAKAPFMAWNNAWYNAPCAFWPTRAKQPVDVTNDKLPPVLLFQATDDAATPYEGGVTMHHLLRGSGLVVEEGGGNHGITLSGNTCLDGHLAAYLRTGKVPHGRGEADATCATLPAPKPLPAQTTPSSQMASRTAPNPSRGSKLHGLLGFRG